MALTGAKSACSLTPQSRADGPEASCLTAHRSGPPLISNVRGHGSRAFSLGAYSGLERNTSMVALTPRLLSRASCCRLGPLCNICGDCDWIVVGKAMGSRNFLSCRQRVRYLLRHCLLPRRPSLRWGFLELQHAIGSIAANSY